MIEKDNTPSDEAVQGQNALLETLRGEPYFRSFNPRAYPLFISRHYKPREYLEQIGVEKIGELIQHGLSLGDICKVLDVSTRVLRCWVFEEPTRIAEIQEARVFAADELVAETRRVANDCNIWPDTDRARLIVSTNQWIAERWDKDLYGTKQVKMDHTLNAGIGFQFVINPEKPIKQAIEGVCKDVSSLPEPSDIVTDADDLFIMQEISE